MSNMKKSGIFLYGLGIILFCIKAAVITNESVSNFLTFLSGYLCGGGFILIKYIAKK